MITVHNTQTKDKQEIQESSIRMFVCGPTVYDYIHIGNARTYVVFDMIAKWLRHKGLDVKYLMNITDLDDKIISRAQEQGIEWKNLAKQYEEAFQDDVQALGIDAVDEYHRSGTDYIPEIIQQVQTLIDKGHAYVIDNDGVYFDLSSFKDYGKLSGRTQQMADDGVSRIDESENKRNKGDFAVWKFSKDGEPSWDAPFGAGRPGWHIEDTAMTEKHFGPQYELHGAGIDLMFPHHEAELSIMESISGREPFVKYWMHVGFLTNKGARMGKSNQNFLTLREALETYSPEALRFYFLSAHYRAPLEYTEENLNAAEAAVQRIANFKAKMKQIASNASESPSEPIDTISKEMDDDFNTPKAFAHLFEYIKKTNSAELNESTAQTALGLLGHIQTVFGIVPQSSTISSEIQSLVDQREEARKNKDFDLADKLRDDITSHGYSIDDTPYGPFIKQK